MERHYLINEQKELFDNFLSRWTIESVKNLTLPEYVGIGNKDTFCQWVETKTRILGSIKGYNSIKFGIYERIDSAKKPPKFKNDEKYSWKKSYGNDRESAFENIKRDIIKIIQFSENGNFEQIDNIPLSGLFKWKVAFLYSNERLIPIYKKDVLFKIAEHFGLKGKDIPISKIQDVMMLHKPALLNVYEFMRQLYDKFGSEKDKKDVVESPTRKRKTTRKATSEKSTDIQVRTVTSRSCVTQQKHNKIQEALKALLVRKYGEENVKLEENHVDVKLLQHDCIYFYEVKSYPYATDCIREALGQILLYSLNDKDPRPKKHIVVGQYPANDEDKKYIDFLKDILNLEFCYMNVEIRSCV